MKHVTTSDSACIAIGTKVTPLEKSVSRNKKNQMENLSIKEWMREIRVQKLERKISMKNRNLMLFAVTSMFTPVYALASVQGMMENLQSAILNILAPTVCVGAIIFNGFKLAMGDESGKRALFWSCVGTVISFTAPSIIQFLRNQVAN